MKIREWYVKIMYLIKGEVKDFTLAYVISKNYLSEKKLDKLLHEDIYLCFKAYPVRQAIVIRGIDG